MDFEAQPGALIEFDTGDDYRLAMITEFIGKKKLVLLLASGDEMRTTPKHVTFELGKASVDNLHSARSTLQTLDATIQSRQNDVEVLMLWEFTREEEEPLTATDLAELMFADTDPSTVLAIIRALRDDVIYFKSRRDGRYEPRPDDQVTALKDQEAARQRKENERDRVLHAIVDTLNAPKDLRAQQIQTAIGDDDALRNAIHLLQDYAAAGEDFLRRQDADDLLNDLASLLNRSLKGRLGLKAFYLLVDLGIWEEHQNLWMHRYRIDPTFSNELLATAKALADTPWQPESWREDLTYLTAVTIDGPSTRDFDDALSVQPTIDGGWELFIHIADPSAFIDINSPLDIEARRRATSVYLPTQTIPMFPSVLSDGKMSLLQGQLRPAMTAKITFNENLEPLHSTLLLSTIQVDRNLTYDDVDTMLHNDTNDRFTSLVRNLRFIADECYNRRVEAGAFSFDLPETKLSVDRSVDPPLVSVAAIHTDTPSRTLVSELMILNNETIGRFCAHNDIPAIYRIQESPDDDLDDPLLLALPPGPARAFAQIRKMKPGEISTSPGLHFGLGLYHYAQASSPIRRYSDLLCQRQITAFLRNQPLPYNLNGVLQLLATLDGAMGAAYDTERSTTRYWLTFYLQQQSEPQNAIVVEHKDDRGERVSVFLTDCAYRANCTLHTPIPVGAPLQVTVERADPRLDTLTLRSQR